MLADRVRMGSGGNNEVSVNIQVKDKSKYTSPSEKVYIRPIIRGFELVSSDFDAPGEINETRLSDIISLYCADPITIPRGSTINVSTLKSEYFIISKFGGLLWGSAELTNRNVTVENLSLMRHDNWIVKVPGGLEDGDIMEVEFMFD